METGFLITCRGSPPYGDLVRYRILVQKVAISDPKTAYNASCFEKSDADDEFRMCHSVYKKPYPSVIFFSI